MNKELNKKIFAVGITLIGILAIVFAIIYFCAEPCGWDHCSYVQKEIYGGDAYTGIQNAAAVTANNINYLDLNLQDATKFFAGCMGVIFLVVGLLLLLIGTTKIIAAFTKEPMINEVQTTVENY